ARARPVGAAPPAPAADAGQGLVLAEHLEALEQSRRDVRSRHCKTDRLKRLAWLEPALLCEAPQRGLDAFTGERLDGLERQRHLGQVDALLRSGPGEEESGELRELAERRDLLLDERRGAADQLHVPLVALLLQVRDEPVRVLVGRQGSEVDAVEPLELLEVEDGRACPDAMKREPLDELLA